MDLVDHVKDKLPADKLAAMKDWYAWCEAAAERYAKELRSKLAFELGHIPPELVAATKAAFVAAMRESGRHIVSTKLCDTIRADADASKAD